MLPSCRVSNYICCKPDRRGLDESALLGTECPPTEVLGNNANGRGTIYIYIPEEGRWSLLSIRTQKMGKAFCFVPSEERGWVLARSLKPTRGTEALDVGSLVLSSLGK